MNDYQNNGLVQIDSCGFDDLAEALRLVCRWQRAEVFESILASQAECTLGFDKWWHNPDFGAAARCLPKAIGIDEGAKLLWRWLQSDASLARWLNDDVQVYQVLDDGSGNRFSTFAVNGGPPQPYDGLFSKQLPEDQHGRAAIIVMPRQGVNLERRAERARYPEPPEDNERRWKERRNGTPGAAPFVRGWSLRLGGRHGFIGKHGAQPSLHPIWMRGGCRCNGLLRNSAAYEAAVAEELAR